MIFEEEDSRNGGQGECHVRYDEVSEERFTIFAAGPMSTTDEHTAEVEA